MDKVSTQYRLFNGFVFEISKSILRNARFAWSRQDRDPDVEYRQANSQRCIGSTVLKSSASFPPEKKRDCDMSDGLTQIPVVPLALSKMLSRR